MQWVSAKWADKTQANLIYRLAGLVTSIIFPMLASVAIGQLEGDLPYLSLFAFGATLHLATSAHFAWQPDVELGPTDTDVRKKTDGDVREPPTVGGSGGSASATARAPKKAASMWQSLKQILTGHDTLIAVVAAGWRGACESTMYIFLASRVRIDLQQSSETYIWMQSLASTISLVVMLSSGIVLRAFPPRRLYLGLSTICGFAIAGLGLSGTMGATMMFRCLAQSTETLSGETLPLGTSAASPARLPSVPRECLGNCAPLAVPLGRRPPLVVDSGSLLRHRSGCQLDVSCGDCG